MKQKLQDLSLVKLCDLLLHRTEDLLSAIDSNLDGVALRDLRAEVEEIRAEILKRRVEETSKT
jgi:hypothetical protein